MNVNQMAAVAGFAFIVAFIHFGCTSPESSTKVSKGVFRNMEIRIATMEAGEDSLPYAEIVEGDSTLFLYSEYTDYGEEGDGFKFGFHIDPNLDSAAYSPTGMEKRIIGYGTGMAPGFADTLEIYEFKVSKHGQTVRIAGTVDGIKISGDYIPE